MRDVVSAIQARARGSLEPMVLPGVDLRGGVLLRAGLEGANLEGGLLDHGNLSGARLVGAQLQRASLKGTELNGADLTGAALRGADLEGARLEGACLAHSVEALYRQEIMPDLCAVRPDRPYTRVEKVFLFRQDRRALRDRFDRWLVARGDGG
jgi:uncharacterized protein YjbI with pentapeptide repeats